MTVKRVPINKTKDSPYNPRSFYDPEKIKELAASIKENGMLQIPKARENPEGIFEVLGGYRRRAYELLAQEDEKFCDIPLDVVKMSDTQMAIGGLEENLKRQNMSPMDTARAIAKYFEFFPDAKEEELMIKLSMSQSVVSNMRRVARLPDEITKLIDEEVLTYSQARELASLASIDGMTKGTVESKKVMLAAIEKMGKDLIPDTVKGMQLAIFYALRDVVKYLSPETTFFDITVCEKCEKSIKAYGPNGEPAFFCCDTVCYDHQQKVAIRTREEEAAEKAELAKKAEAERLAKEKAEQPPEEEKAPSNIHEVDHGRLLEKGDIHESFDPELVAKQKVTVAPFDVEGARYYNTGDSSTVEGGKAAYKVVPRTEFTGEIRSLEPLKSENPEEVAAFRKTLLADPLGALNGVVVTYQALEFVLVGPPQVFIAKKDTIQYEEAKQRKETKHENKVEKEEKSTKVSAPTKAKAQEVLPPGKSEEKSNANDIYPAGTGFYISLGGLSFVIDESVSRADIEKAIDTILFDILNADFQEQSSEGKFISYKLIYVSGGSSVAKLYKKGE